MPPTQTRAWLEWIGTEPVAGVEYKWAGTPAAYRDALEDAEELRGRLWDQPGEELSM